MNIVEQLKACSDSDYLEFDSKLIPNVDKSKFLGVRIPILRQFSKTLNKDDIDNFINSLPHYYKDENMLHSILLSKEKNYNMAINKINEFLPFIDNWAVCDTLSIKDYNKHKEELLSEIKKWLKSNHTFTLRFAVDCLMTYFLNENDINEYLSLVKNVKSNEYYVNMMCAWFFATALSVHWEDTIKILQDKSLNLFVHNKTIQKAIESFRISKEQKEFLKSLKIKE